MIFGCICLSISRLLPWLYVSSEFGISVFDYHYSCTFSLAIYYHCSAAAAAATGSKLRGAEAICFGGSGYFYWERLCGVLGNFSRVRLAMDTARSAGCHE